MSAFAKNQIVYHNTWGECIAIRAWNDKETVCLVTRTGQRHVLMNCFLQPLLGPGPFDRNIAVISDEVMEEFESKFIKKS